MAQRMRIVLLLDEGTSYRDIEEKLGAAPSTVSRWKQRHEKDGVLGLATIHPGQPPQKLTPQLRARVALLGISTQTVLLNEPLGSLIFRPVGRRGLPPISKTIPSLFRCGEPKSAGCPVSSRPSEDRPHFCR